ncbi:MAG TPA: hypothetical protein VGQ10_08970 [Vicinamibacterales bacterium]|jgi:hypothetical protein|nr:hypothetical protein [Vicinamibacterales bacterium]
MDLYTLSLAMTIAGNVGYHLLNKTVAPAAHPFASLVATYTVGLVIALGVLAYDAPRGIAVSLRELNWASYALGAVVISLEVGFLLVYRAGWRVSVAALYSNVAVGLLLIPIGTLLYRETLTISQGAGIVLAIVSLILMSR